MENSSNKAVNIHSLCDEVNVDIPTLSKIIEKVRTEVNDKSTKAKLTKLSKLLFQSLPQ